MASCSKTEICHPEEINGIAPEKRGNDINEMVIYRFHYVTGKRLGAFPARRRAFQVVQQGLSTFLTEV
jgi:hypothetical protein